MIKSDVILKGILKYAKKGNCTMNMYMIYTLLLSYVRTLDGKFSLLLLC